MISLFSSHVWVLDYEFIWINNKNSYMNTWPWRISCLYTWIHVKNLPSIHDHETGMNSYHEFISWIYQTIECNQKYCGIMDEFMFSGISAMNSLVKSCLNSSSYYEFVHDFMAEFIYLKSFRMSYKYFFAGLFLLIWVTESEATITPFCSQLTVSPEQLHYCCLATFFSSWEKYS